MSKNIIWLDRKSLQGAIIELVAKIDTHIIVKTNKGYYDVTVNEDTEGVISISKNRFQDWFDDILNRGCNDKQVIEKFVNLELITEIEANELIQKANNHSNNWATKQYQYWKDYLEKHCPELL